MCSFVPFGGTAASRRVGEKREKSYMLVIICVVPVSFTVGAKLVLYSSFVGNVILDQPPLIVLHIQVSIHLLFLLFEITLCTWS